MDAETKQYLDQKFDLLGNKMDLLNTQIFDILEDHIWSSVSLTIRQAYQLVLNRTATFDEMRMWKEAWVNNQFSIDEVYRVLEEELPQQSHIIKGNFIDLEQRSGNKSTHFIMSVDISDSKKREIIAYHINQGYNVISIMPWFYEDYNGARFPVNYSSTANHPSGVALKDHWIHWMLVECRNKGLEPIIWMMTDDNMPFYERSNLEQVKAKWEDFISSVVQPLQLKYLIIGLEALEYWSETQVIELGNWLKARCPWADIGFHSSPGDRRLINQSTDFYHTLYYQYSTEEREDVEAIKIATQQLTTLTNKKIIASEYALNGESEFGKSLGDAALSVNGCVGAINGCH